MNSVGWRNVCLVLLCVFPAGCLFNVSFAADGEHWDKGLTAIILENGDTATLNSLVQFTRSRRDNPAVILPDHVLFGWFKEKTIAEVRKIAPVKCVARVDDFLQFDPGGAGDIPNPRILKNIFFPSKQSVKHDSKHPLIGDVRFQEKSASSEEGLITAPLRSRQKMVNTIASIFIFVESDGSLDPDMYTWTVEDEDEVLAAAVRGFAWWSQEAAKVNVDVTFTVVGIRATEGEITHQAYEPVLHPSTYDHYWVSAIMENLDVGSGQHDERVWALNDMASDHLQTEFAMTYIMCYNPIPAPTQFTDGYAAWAKFSGPYTQILWRTFGWGVETVITHESGHLYQACDEYYVPGYGGCTECNDCNGTGIPNGNCEYCNPDSIPCMMRENAHTLCYYTKWQIGWINEAPTPEPLPVNVDIRMSANKSRYGRDEIIDAYMVLVNWGGHAVKDAYAAVGFAGNLYFYPYFGAAPTPTTFEMPEDYYESIRIFRADTKCLHGTGNHLITLYGALTDPGTHNIKAYDESSFSYSDSDVAID